MWTEEQNKEYQKEWKKNNPTYWRDYRRMMRKVQKEYKSEKEEWIPLKLAMVELFPLWFTKLVNASEMRMASIMYMENWTKEDRIYLKSIN